MRTMVEGAEGVTILDESFFSSLVQLSPEAIAVHARGRIVFANAAAIQLLGASMAEEVVGRKVADFLKPGTAALLLGREAEAGQDGASFMIEDCLLRLDGKPLDVEISVRPRTSHHQATTQLVLRDITRRKHSDALLRESQRTLAEAQRLTKTGSWELGLANTDDLDSNPLRWSDEVFRIFGLEPGAIEVTNDAFFHFVHPEDRARISEAVREAVSAGRPYRIEHRIVLKDGTERIVQQQSQIVRDPTGKPEKMVGVIQDVTEQKYVEEALRESQAKWRALAENAPDTIMTVDADGTILFINRTLERRENLIGSTIFPLAAPEFRSMIRLSLERVFETGESMSYEHRGSGPGGTQSWFASRMGPIRSRNKVVAVALISTDITKRKAAEADLVAWKNRYESVLQASGQIIYDRDPVRNVVTFGGSLEKTLGYRPDEMPATMEGWAALVHPDDRAEFLGRNEGAGESKHAFHLEYRLRQKDGEYLIVKDDGYFTADPDGRIVQMLGFIADISRQRTLESQLRHSQKMEAFGRLAGGVAHDFNNLLTVIAGYNDIMLHDLSANDPRREFVEEIGKAADRASSLTGQLLAFSRQQVLQPRVLDLNSVLEDTGKMLRRLIGEDINLVMAPADSIGYVKADLSQLENVLVNLAVNARDAMPDGGTLTVTTANVTVSAEHPEVARGLVPGDHILLSVSDTGVGMSETVKDRIFEPFFTTKAIGHGTGLGLATCYGIVKQSGGHIGVESKVGSGATFQIYLPRVQDTPEETSARRELCGMVGGTETILVVEDEPAVRRLAVSILKGLGYTVLEAGNGEEAFMVMQTSAGEKMDLVVTDIVMPEMGGKDLAYWVRSSRPKAKILFTSGYPDHALDDSSAFGGDTAFMPKPYAPKHFAAIVRALLDGTSVPEAP